MSQFGSNSAGESRRSVTQFIFGPYSLRTDDLLLHCRGEAVPLAPKVALTLVALVEHAGEVLSKEELFQIVWSGAAVEESNLSQNIYTLRRLFEGSSGDSLIETLPRRGYRFTGFVKKFTPADRSERAKTSLAWSILSTAACVAIGGAVLFVSGARPWLSAQQPDAQSFAAEQAYQTGWFYYRQGTTEGFRTAVRYFQRAADVKPTSLLGESGEAVALAQLSDNEGDSQSSIADASRAEWLAHHRLADRADSSVALAAKGFVEFDLDGDFNAAARDLKRAEVLDPQNAPAFLWYGGVLLWQGRLAAARSQLLRATSLDASLPSIDYLLAWDYYLGRDFSDAMAFAKLALSDPFTGDESHLLLAAADEGAGRFKPAIAAVAGLSSGPTDEIAACATRAHIYAAMGDSVGAARELSTVERLTIRYKQRPLLTALAYLANGQSDEAFAWLSRLSQYDRTILAMDPRLDRVRHDPRFARWLHG